MGLKLWPISREMKNYCEGEYRNHRKKLMNEEI